MITLEKISYLFYVLCALQWQNQMGVDSAATASSNQVSFGAANGDLSKDASSGLMGAIYRKSRQSRCVTCYDDRYDDRSRYYGSYSARSGDDRSSNWYYPRYDRYSDDRYRGGESEYDRYAGGERYGYRDDRYDSRTSYDRYDTRGYSRYGDRRGSYDRGESRGYGYDNRDRYYGSERGGDSYRDRYYERPRYGQSGSPGGAYGYDRDYHDRYSPRYEFRNYRPWDETYSGQSGSDSSGRGYYYAKGVQEDRRYLPEPPYRPQSPCGAQRPNCPQEGGTRVTSGPIDSGSYNKGYSQSTYNANPHQNGSSKGAGSGWSYMREDETNQQAARGGNGNSSGVGGGSSNSASSRDRNRDQQSPAYGALLDRGSNLIAVEPATKAADDAQPNAEKTQSSSSSGDDNQSHSANGQNS